MSFAYLINDVTAKFLSKKLIPPIFIRVTALCSAQKPAQIEILNANSLEYDESTGKKAKKLIGDVQLKHDDVLMFCDSAYVFSESNSMHAYSRVKFFKAIPYNLRATL